tara:strand:- start:6777 stop:8396 length:1620 start_codon:yes stop_codon:yes gene_type:complete
MGKEIFHGKESREKLLKGVNELANAVSVTLGPRGRNVIIDGSDGTPHITKDGVTVAKSVEFTDRTVNLGATIIKEASQQTADNAGDGTTTSTVLAQHIFNEGMKRVESGCNPIELNRGMQEAVSYVVSALRKISVDINDNDSIKNIATISANGDTEIGNIIADAIKEVGNDGIVTVEEGNSSETTLEIVEGLEFDRGYLSHFFMNDKTKLVCSLESPKIMLYDGRISTMDDIVGVLEKSSMNNQPIVIMAHEITGEALATMVVNSARGTLNCLAVKAPGFGAERTEMLKDIATLTGATLITSEIGVTLEDVAEEHLGSCDKVVSGKTKTSIIGGHGDTESISERIEMMKVEKQNSESDYEKEKIQTRLSKLAGGVAVIQIGAESEIELKEKKDRVDDAILSTKAALEEGVVPGGGSALIHSKNNTVLKYHKMISEKRSDEWVIGMELVYDACEAPLRTILKNAGVSDIDGIIKQVSIKSISDCRQGYNVVRGNLVDLVTGGVIDPTKVTRIAIEKAVSVAGTLLTTECMVVNEIINEKS